MTFSFKFIDGYLLNLLKREADAINQARIKMLVYIILAHIFFAAILITAYTIQGLYLQLIRISIVMFCCFLCLVIFKYANAWKIISHVMCWLLTLVVWSNLILFVRGINVATLQYVWFACALGFFMLGLKWGWFYSIINTLPLIIYTGMDGNFYFLGSGPQQLERFTYIFVISYDFAIIIFLHYFFFQAYQKNFVRLTDAKNELNDVNNKLNVALFDLEKLSKDRMNFLSTMSHELRTPMNGVIGISNSLILQNPREDQKESMAILKFSAENLLHLINEILDFNKLDADKVELENTPFDLAALIKNNFAGHEYKAAEKLLDFNYTIDERLKGKIIFSDPTRLSQIISNLLNNAIKFTKKGYVKFHTQIIELKDKILTVRFSVDDTGIGIDSGRQNDVFEAYIQASPSINRNYGGTGLGLPIVKKVLDMFNSQPILTSEINVGTRIYFDIEFLYEESVGTLAAAKSTGKIDVSHLRVLVAEDNKINIIVITKTLQRWGIDPVIAENGLQVLNVLEMRDFDIILMDLHMPEMDGYEAATAVRALDDDLKSAIPIIAFTATAEADLLKKITAAGMDDFLSKPFKPEDLLSKLQYLTSSNY
ncbi:MAG: response regulator [Pedobacter sp.]|nr:MAG: response regulator [Pedobacter sp.]